METVWFGVLAVVWLAGESVYIVFVPRSTQPTYTARHRAGHVEYVSRFYAPAGIRYPELWKARIEGSMLCLVIKVKDLNDCAERALAERLSNWEWTKVPTTDWPESWRMMATVSSPESPSVFRKTRVAPRRVLAMSA